MCLMTENCSIRQIAPYDFVKQMKLFFGLLLLLVAGGFSFASTDSDEEACRLWMAPSSLSAPGTVQFGLFAGIDFDKNDIIPDVELAIPFVDFFFDGNKDTEYAQGIVDYLENHMWASDYASSKFEGNVSTAPFLPGVGTLGNYHSLISNANWLSPASFLREREDITEPGKPHLSRGAITNIYNLTMVASQRIPMGMEIFPSFGDSWDKEESSLFQDKLSRKDIIEADQVLDRIVEFYDRFESQMTDDLKDDILDFMLDKVLGAAAGKRAAGIRSLIPQNYRKIRKVREAGGVFLYRYRDSIKNPKWLSENGVCVDTMYPAKSTIAAAGRGAFASKDFAAGESITVVPTLLFGDKDLMNMYDIVTLDEDSSDDQTPKTTYEYNHENPRGQQIGINYAFGHPESSFLFLPISPIVNFINHNSSPNARLQWSTHKILKHDKATWDYSVSEVMNFKSNMVIFEIEAITDIKKGDEIFIHYGEDWVQAWAIYESMWEEKYRNQRWPLRAEDVKITFKEKPYPVEENNLLPPGVATACFIKCDVLPDGQPQETEDGTPIQQWVGPVEYEDFSGALLTMCDLLDRHDDNQGSYNYTVIARIMVDGQADVTQVVNVPHSAVTVVDTPYSGDLHWPEAFRHFIGIPNEIFPQNWRDLR